MIEEEEKLKQKKFIFLKTITKEKTALLEGGQEIMNQSPGKSNRVIK